MSTPDVNLGSLKASLDRSITYMMVHFCCWFKSVLSATVHGGGGGERISGLQMDAPHVVFFLMIS